jgi:Protein of unknown function (DUF2612)
MSLTTSTYTALITSEHNQRPKFMAMIAAIVQAAVDQQNELSTFPALFDVDLAVGDQLDKIGLWVGVSRNLPIEVGGISTLPDASYRILVKLFIAMNQWDGTVPGIYNVWNSVFAAEGYKILVQDDQDMTMFVVFLNPPTDIVILSILTEGYFLLRPAGVRIIGYFEPSVPSIPLFGFDAEDSMVSGFDVGDWVVPIVV